MAREHNGQLYPFVVSFRVPETDLNYQDDARLESAQRYVVTWYRKWPPRVRTNIASNAFVNAIAQKEIIPWTPR